MVQKAKEIRLDVLILPHQDDEIFILPLIIEANPRLVIYMSFGTPENSFGRKNSRIRCDESSRSWNALGGHAHIIQFGLEFGLRDGLVHNDLHYSHVEILLSIIKGRGAKRIITTALEGGNQDHDTCNVLSRYIGQSLNIPVVDFNTYRSSNLPGGFLPFYRVMCKHQASDTPPSCLKLRFNYVYRSLVVAKVYSSQYKTWFGLLPFIIGKYILGTQNFGIVDITRKPDINSKPLYEIRRRESRSSWENQVEWLWFPDLGNKIKK